MENDKEKTITTTIEVSVNVKTFDMNKNELIDAIASGSKLTKADAGRELDGTIGSIKKELWLNFHLEPTTNADGTCGCPKVDVNYHEKPINTSEANI
jgi:hypothetical protein